MTREELLNINAGIVRDVAANAVKHSPDAVIIIFANPMDAMCHVALEATGLPKSRIIGQGGMLDTARYRTFIAWETQSSVQDVHAQVLGGHTDVTMVPIVSTAHVGGVPLTSLLPKERIEAVVQRTRKGGTEVVSLLKTGSAFVAPAAATVEMVESVLLDKNRIIPCAAYLKGEFDIQNAFVGVPVKLGACGIDRIYQPPPGTMRWRGCTRPPKPSRSSSASSRRRPISAMIEVPCVKCIQTRSETPSASSARTPPASSPRMSSTPSSAPASRRKPPWPRRCWTRSCATLSWPGDEMLPLCQDTGTTVIFLEVGQDLHIVGGPLADALREGVGAGYTEGFLRASIVEKPFLGAGQHQEQHPTGVTHRDRPWRQAAHQGHAQGRRLREHESFHRHAPFGREAWGRGVRPQDRGGIRRQPLSAHHRRRWHRRHRGARHVPGQALTHPQGR